jgi:hypothetical protein
MMKDLKIVCQHFAYLRYWVSDYTDKEYLFVNTLHISDTEFQITLIRNICGLTECVGR